MENKYEKHVIFKYEKLCVLGIFGNLSKSLESILKTDIGTRIELAPIKHESNRNFLAGISFNPFVHITFVQTSSDISIVTYSLDELGSKRILYDLITKLEFMPQPTPNSFFRVLNNEMGVEIESYEMLKLLSSKLQADLDIVFSAITY